MYEPSGLVTPEHEDADDVIDLEKKEEVVSTFSIFNGGNCLRLALFHGRKWLFALVVENVGRRNVFLRQSLTEAVGSKAELAEEGEV